MERAGILVIDASDWDREQVRAGLRPLQRRVRILDPADLESGARPDLIVMGYTDAVSFETARSQLERARRLAPHAQLILCAPRGEADTDARVLDLRARAFLLKPIDADVLRGLVDETLTWIERRRRREALARARRKTDAITEVIGSSAAIREVLSVIRRTAASPTTSLLLLGESGVGKTLFAQTVHDLGGAHGPFVEINCAAVPPNLLESELFGYEAGAFTDARRRKMGLIELADGGTLFLDEIAEMEPVTQAKLLKFLDARRLRRLGGGDEIDVEVRVVAATNRDIRAEVRAGRFREDLYYRLGVVEVTVPALRERPEDIDPIVDYYLRRFGRQFGKPALGLSPEARRVLHAYPWPGNVRELVNALERAALMCPGERIEPAHLPVQPARRPRRVRFVRAPDDGELELEIPDAGLTLAEVEAALIRATLRHTHGNVSRAAARLGLSRGALRHRLERLGIDPHAFAGPSVGAIPS